MRRRISHDGGKTFGAPHPFIDTPGTFIRQRIITLASGELLLPVFQCRKKPDEAWTGNLDTSAVLRSADKGEDVERDLSSFLTRACAHEYCGE